MQAVYELKKSYIPDLFPEISLPAFLAMQANTINALIDNMLHSTSCFFWGGDFGGLLWRSFANAQDDRKGTRREVILGRT